MKIGIYSNPQKDIDGRTLARLIGIAEENGVEAEPFDDSVRYGLIVSIGGDGTILRVAKHAARADIPVLGVNTGTLGFLTEVEPDGFGDALARLKKGDYALERRALIDVCYNGEHVYALNDAVIRSVGGRLIDMEVRVGSELIDKFACDGYIACTPTGSTAYSLSAGGSVIGPNTPVIALTPINPHTLRTKSIVVGSFENIELKYVGARTKERGASALYVDGEQVTLLDGGETVSVTGWDRSVRFIRFGAASFYSRLLGKLNSWSAGD